MKLIPERELRKLIINNNRIVGLKHYLDNDSYERLRKEQEYYLIEFVHSSEHGTLAICEVMKDQIYSSQKRKKDDLVSFKITDIRFIYE